MGGAMCSCKERVDETQNELENKPIEIVDYEACQEEVVQVNQGNDDGSDFVEEENDKNYTFVDVNIEESLLNDFQKTTLEAQGDQVVDTSEFNQTSQFKDGTIYRGSMQCGQRSGYGTSFKDQIFYNGQWQSDQQQGDGFQLLPNGDWLQGTWEDGEFVVGRGFVTSEDSCNYEGGLVRNDAGDLVRDGEGVLNNTQKHYSYAGGFKNGVKNGFGKQKYLTSQNSYSGYYTNGLPDGWGQFNFHKSNETDRVYTGQWCKGKMDGVGTYMKKGEMTYRTYKNSKNVSEVSYEEGRRQGLQDTVQQAKLDCEKRQNMMSQGL